MTDIKEYSATEAGLATMRQRLQGVVFDLTTTKGNQEARQARKQLVSLRTGIEAKRLELKRPLLAQIEGIDGEAKRITAEIVAIEKPLDDAIKADEDRREAEKIAKAQVERERIQAHQTALQQIADCAIYAVGQPSEQIRKWVEGVDQTVTGPEWEEFQQLAVAAKAKTLETLRDLLAKAEAAEAEAKRLAEERAELERQRAEQQRIEAEAAERRRQEEVAAAEARRKAEEEAAAVRRAAEAAAAEERRKQEAEAAARRAEIERQEREARERIQQQEREAREARELADAEARKAREAEEARLRAERDRLDAERRQREEQEAAARREQAEREATARRAEEERQLVAQRAADRLLHGREMLQAFADEYATDPEFAAIVPAIREFLGEALQRRAA